MNLISMTSRMVAGRIRLSRIRSCTIRPPSSLSLLLRLPLANLRFYRAQILTFWIRMLYIQYTKEANQCSIVSAAKITIPLPALIMAQSENSA